MSFRAFIAADVEPDDSLKDILGQLRRSGADLKVVRPELLHLTLKFLGETDEGAVDDIASKMQDAVKGVPAFSVKFVGMGAFPSMSNIRVLWVGMEAADPLQDIARRLDDSLRELGFERDRKGFKAHLTVARARSSARMGAAQAVLKQNAASDFGTYQIGSIRLKKSVLSPQGPHYSDVIEVPLSH